MATIVYIGIVTLAIALLGYFASRKIKRYKYELEETTKNFALAMEAGALSTWKYDIKNRYFTPLMGQVVAGEGLSWEDSLQILHPDDHTPLKELFEILCSNQQEAGELVVRYFSPEHDDYRYYESKMSIRRNAEGITTHIIGTQHDITEKRIYQLELDNARKSIELAMNAAEITAWDYDIRSAKSRTLYGDYLSRKKTTMDDSCDWMHPDDVEAYRVFVNGLLQNPDLNIATTVIRIRKEDQTYRQSECTISVIRNDKGEPTHLIGSLLDITERNRMITALEKAKEKAEESDRLKSAFLANMSHEIRTPLNAIVGFSDLLLVTEDEEEKEQYGKIISANNELLLQLINDILDLSKIESGMVNLTPQEVDLTMLIDELATAMRPRVKEGVELISHCPYESCLVWVDPNRLTQVITNFATNAIKFTTQGQIKMGYEYNDEGVRLYVSDTGIGIAKSKQSKVFNRFEKLDDFAQGTGLGLSISKAIAEAYNGTIGVDSALDQGSTFWIRIPIQATIRTKKQTPNG